MAPALEKRERALVLHLFCNAQCPSPFKKQGTGGREPSKNNKGERRVEISLQGGGGKFSEDI